jgi:Adenylate and Guanylate cyclase catalytic domain
MRSSGVSTNAVFGSLFVDTMNTCSRIESTGERNKIHISAETAACLQALGKGNWVQERDDIITAKGKGNLQTYWLNFRPQSAPSTRSGSSENDTDGRDDPQKVLEAQKTTTPQSTYGNDMVVSARTVRLIEWNVDVLKKVLQQIRVRRVALGTGKEKFEDPQDSFDGSILDEVKEIIRLPNFNASLEDAADKDPIEVDPNAIEQLRAYITMISQLYRENPFHCFEHASHVTMSVTKLLSRIIAPDGKNLVGKDDEVGNVAARLHDHTYGITSDPLTQFACIFAALIHDGT